jgi:mannose-1-phosphate guanylyltransferase
MRYAMIMAGGAGTRLWPMSRAKLPKQLIPFIDGKSLLQIAYERFDGLVPGKQRLICAGETHRAAVLAGIPTFDGSQFLGEPTGRDTLNAVGFTAAVLAKRDPEAVIGVFTADHIIEPVGGFQKDVEAGFRLVEEEPNTLVTFGIQPTGPATGYGYLELGAAINDRARVVERFREKPALDIAQQYFESGPNRHLWNSGMFVWRTSTLLDCIHRYQPEVHAGLMEIAHAWDTRDQQAVIQRVYPALKKISVDFAVMEPASQDTLVNVAAIPMALKWLDVGSWPSFAATRPRDDAGNAIAAGKHVLVDSTNCLVASNDPDHLIATIGCEDLVIIHTDNATLICRGDQAEKIKELQKNVERFFGADYT